MTDAKQTPAAPPPPALLAPNCNLSGGVTTDGNGGEVFILTLANGTLAAQTVLTPDGARQLVDVLSAFANSAGAPPAKLIVPDSAGQIVPIR